MTIGTKHLRKFWKTLLPLNYSFCHIFKCYLDSTKKKKKSNLTIVCYCQTGLKALSQTSYEEFHAKLFPRQVHVHPHSLLWNAADSPLGSQSLQTEPASHLHYANFTLKAFQLCAIITSTDHTTCCHLIERHLCNNKVRGQRESHK